MRFRKPRKLGAVSESWLRHDGLVLECTAATCLYFCDGFSVCCVVAPLLGFCGSRSVTSTPVRRAMVLDGAPSEASMLVAVAEFMMRASVGEYRPSDKDTEVI